MQEQGTGWGLTVSRRFDASEGADNAVQKLQDAGFREDQLRVWQQSPYAEDADDRLGRTAEGLLGGGFVSATLAMFLVTTYSWVSKSDISMELTAIAAVVAGVIGSIVGIAVVSILSTRYSFDRDRHEHSARAGTVVTVTVGDRETDARTVFDGIS